MSTYQIPTTDILDQGNRPGDGPLRPGGQPSPVPITNDADLPSTQSACVKKQMPALTLVRDLAAGPERVREKATTYLPQAPGEDPQNYKVRLNRSVFFNVFGHTIKGLVGQIFRRDPVLGDDVPPVIVKQCENIDLMGTHFDVFARDISEDAMTAGHAAILVDFPQTDGTQNRQAEMSGEIRPYWVPIRKDDIVSWRCEHENGHMILAQLVLRECAMVPDGMFGEREQERYRVFYRVREGASTSRSPTTAVTVGVKVLQINKDKTVTVVSEGLYPTQTEIPVAEIITSGRVSMFESAPPLVDLAYLNVAHYQQWSDYATSIHKTCVPIFTTIGIQEMVDGNGQPLVLGPNASVNLPAGGDAKYVAHDGAALQQCKQALDDLKSDMGTLGLSMLSPSKRTAETAQAKRLDKSTEDSALAVTARGLQDGLERALAFHAKYLKLEDGGSVDVNREFDEQTMQSDMLTAWAGAVQNAGVPPRLMAAAMQDGGLIGPDEDIDEIADEMAANGQAAADQKQIEAAARLSTATAMSGTGKMSAGGDPMPMVDQQKNAA